MSSRRWLAIAGLSCALLGAWGAFAFLREPPAGDGGGASNRSTPAAASGDHARGEAGAGAANDGATTSDFAPTVVAVEPRLEWPDTTALRRIEQHGRVLFGGVVYAPDGSPCPGAAVWCNCDRITMTDDHGAWRADVGRPDHFDADVYQVPGLFGTGGFGADRHPAPLLAACKEGVGFDEATVDPVSRRVDFHLHGGLAFRGSVVDNDDLRPVGGAELEARVASFIDRVHADPRGEFVFAALPAGGVDLSGRAPGYDSNGFFPYNFDRGGDVTITFRLTRSYRLRGQFVPWPPRGIAATSASVVVSPRSPHDAGRPSMPGGAVGADGSFDVALPVCPACNVELACDGGTLWETNLDVNEERHDVDLGRIEVGSAAVTGRVVLPAGAPSSAFEVWGISSALPGESTWKPVSRRQPIAADGSFRLDPLPAGRCALTLYLDGNQLAVRKKPTQEDDPYAWGGEAGIVKLEAGETRDVGVFDLAESIVFGTVRDARGESIALAEIAGTVIAGDHLDRFIGFERRPTDDQGRFCIRIGVREESGRAAIRVHARGFAPLRFELDVPERAGCFRQDFILPDGVVLRGRLLDESGVLLPGWSLRAEPADTPADRVVDGIAFDLTRDDGSFEIRGLTSGVWKVRARQRNGVTTEFVKIDPSEGPLTLRVVEGVRLSASH
jgi:hypothetical protein